MRPAPRSLAPAIESLSARLAPATTLARAQGVWGSVTGPAIASAARPSAEREGVLTITCQAAVWAQELTLMEADIVARLNAELGADTIRSLRCHTG